MSTDEIRPQFIGPDWARCTDGLSWANTLPAEVQHPSSVRSNNLWERVACILFFAQRGDFQHVHALLDVARESDDWHLRDCALMIFSLAASSSEVGRISKFFVHPDYDTRLEAYRCAALSCDLDLIAALARHRRSASRSESERVMDHCSSVLEGNVEAPEFAESTLDDNAYVAKVDDKIADIRKTYGTRTAIYAGVPLDAKGLLNEIVALCDEEEPELNGGVIANSFAILEGLTGVPYAGCLDEDCTPIVPKILRTLTNLRLSGELDRFEVGKRYFWGHAIS